MWMQQVQEACQDASVLLTLGKFPFLLEPAASFV